VELLRAYVRCGGTQIELQALVIALIESDGQNGATNVDARVGGTRVRMGKSDSARSYANALSMHTDVPRTVQVTTTTKTTLPVVRIQCTERS